jgi:DNA-binding transcriptional LysR family regulator
VHPFIAAAFAERLVVRLFVPVVRFEYGVLWPSGQRLSRIAQAFLEMLRASTQENVPRADTGRSV